MSIRTGYNFEIMGIRSKIEKQKYLSEGPQSQLTVEVKRLSKIFQKEGTELLDEILSWIKK